MKASAFVWPLGSFFRFFGGVAVDRARRQNVVGRAIEEFGGGGPLIIAVAPEGTRRRAPSWRTGFYHIAVGAKVPIVLGAVDYRRKVATLGPAFQPTGDIEADFRVFRDFYAQIVPRFPDQKSEVRLPPKAPEATD
jgi:1-acyl-sn-glycerol-3-phosphate acyltransferase